MRKQDDETTAAVASIEDAAECGERADALVRDLLGHLGTRTRNELRFASTPATVPVLAEPTSEQHQAFNLIAAPIPLTLRK